MLRYVLIVTDFDDNELFRNCYTSLDVAVHDAVCFDVRYCILSLEDIIIGRSIPVYELIGRC